MCVMQTPVPLSLFGRCYRRRDNSSADAYEHDDGMTAAEALSNHAPVAGHPLRAADARRMNDQIRGSENG